MTIEDLKQDISSVLENAGDKAEFYFLFKNTGGLVVKKVDINYSDQTELTSTFTGHIKNTILLNDDLSLVALSSADDRQNAVYEYDLEKVPPELIHLKKIIEEEHIEKYDSGSDDLTKLEGILILIGNQDSQIALYKHQYPVTLLTTKSGFRLIGVGDQNRFKKLDQDILKINAKFEFFNLNGKYYILDIKTLEKFFGFHDAVKNVAKEGISNIEKTSLVMNCDVLTSRLSDISFSRKLVQSAKNSPVLGIIPNTQIIAFSRSHPALIGRFKYSVDGSQFNLKTQASQGLFLKMLNDDFLQSELTRRYYESIAKNKIQQAETADAAETT